MNIMVTGGAGFIGSNFIRYMLQKHTTYRIVNFDKLTYAGNPENLVDIENDSRYAFVKGDICDRNAVHKVIRENGIDAIVNFAAESHVDRSIACPDDFLKTDIFGTFTLLEAVKEQRVSRFLQIGTDEVYGDFDNGGAAVEQSPLRASSPYSASKAGADLQVLAYHRTFGLPVLITRCTNNYGPYQYPEKMLPLFITNLLEGMKVPVYGDGMQIRDWLYVDDHCSAIDLVLHEGTFGEVYNIGANQNPEVPNMELTRMVLKALELDESRIEYVTDRKGHDRRYAVDTGKIRGMGWQPSVGIAEGLERTVTWYRTNTAWWKKIKSGEYREYYVNTYVNRNN